MNWTEAGLNLKWNLTGMGLTLDYNLFKTGQKMNYNWTKNDNKNVAINDQRKESTRDKQTIRDR